MSSSYHHIPPNIPPPNPITAAAAPNAPSAAPSLSLPLPPMAFTPYDMAADLDRIATELLGCEGGFGQLLGAVEAEAALLADRRRRQEALLTRHASLLGLGPATTGGNGSASFVVASPTARRSVVVDVAFSSPNGRSKSAGAAPSSPPLFSATPRGHRRPFGLNQTHQQQQHTAGHSPTAQPFVASASAFPSAETRIDINELYDELTRGGVGQARRAAAAATNATPLGSSQQPTSAATAAAYNEYEYTQRREKQEERREERKRAKRERAAEATGRRLSRAYGEAAAEMRRRRRRSDESRSSSVSSEDGSTSATRRGGEDVHAKQQRVHIAVGSAPSDPNAVFVATVPTAAPHSAPSATASNGKPLRRGSGGVGPSDALPPLAPNGDGRRRTSSRSASAVSAFVSSSSSSSSSAPSSDSDSDSEFDGYTGDSQGSLSSRAAATALSHGGSSSHHHQPSPAPLGFGAATAATHHLLFDSQQQASLLAVPAGGGASAEAAMAAEDRETARLRALEAHVADVILRGLLGALETAEGGGGGEKGSASARPSAFTSSGGNNNSRAASPTGGNTVGSRAAAAPSSSFVARSDRRDKVTGLLPPASRLVFLLHGHLSGGAQAEHLGGRGGSKKSSSPSSLSSLSLLRHHPMGGRTSRLSVGELFVRCVDAYLRLEQ